MFIYTHFTCKISRIKIFPRVFNIVLPFSFTWIIKNSNQELTGTCNWKFKTVIDFKFQPGSFSRINDKNTSDHGSVKFVKSLDLIGV